MERTIRMTCKTGGIPLKLCYEMPKRNRANLILVLGVLQSVPTKGVYSDYNRPMEMLWTNNRKYLKKDSFVLFLGDYRNNKNKEGTEWLKNIHARAKKMFFLNTDKKEKWGQGDSIAPVYSRLKMWKKTS